MSTAEYPDALTRRLELLAAASGDEPEDESSAVAALVRGLRTELGAVRAELGSLRSETAAVRSGLGGIGSRVERIEALARDGANTTTATLVSLGGGVAALSRKVEDDGQATADLVVGRLREVTESGLSGLRGEVGTALDGVAERVTGAVSALQADQAARDAVTSELLIGLQSTVEALGDRLAVLAATVGQSRTEVTGRVGDLHDVVTRGAGALQETLTGLSALSSSTDALAQTVDGFRTEWPTRTHEVVQGARAVADGVVREVRAEVGAQLERVRCELDRAVGGFDAARDGLHAGTDRLSQAGAVLVAYLEQRDRLLEAERDSVLHDVLDTFAAGLSARDRAALAGRVGDAVARRRDGRDAQRYRAAVGTPVSPTADLPDDVRRLAEVEPAPERTAEPPTPVGPAALGVPAAQGPPTTSAAPVRTADLATPRVALPRVAATRGASGTSVTVRPAAAPSTSAAPPTSAAPSTSAAPAEKLEPPRGEQARPSSGADRRARVDVMPQVRSPEVALEAAAPTPPAGEGHEHDGSVVRRHRP